MPNHHYFIRLPINGLAIWCLWPGGTSFGSRRASLPGRPSSPPTISAPTSTFGTSSLPSNASQRCTWTPLTVHIQSRSRTVCSILVRSMRSLTTSLTPRAPPSSTCFTTGSAPRHSKQDSSSISLGTSTTPPAPASSGQRWEKPAGCQWRR